MTTSEGNTTASYFVHESSYVDTPCEIGEGTAIWHFCHIMTNARLGKQCKLGQNVVIGPDVWVGNNVKIQNNVSVYPGVTLEDDVFCGPSMVFTNIINPRSEINRNSMEHFKKTRVRKGATLGANVTVVCGVTIGQYAFVGAGAVVTKDVPDHALIYGNPAVQHGWACFCGTRLETLNTPLLLECPDCHQMYTLTPTGLQKTDEASNP